MKIVSILSFYRCTSLLLAILVSGMVVKSQTAVTYNVQVMNQIVNDIVYSTKRRLIYASVPSTGGVYGNHLIAISPFSKQVVGSVFVGSEPNRLAISDDQQFIYVGLNGAASVRKVILDTLTADIMFGLGSGSFGLHFPEDLAVLPNQPNSVAVSRRNTCCSPRHEGVAIFDNGVMRPTVTPGHTGSNVIELGSNENVLYGYNNETTDFGFRRMSVTASGVSTISVLQNAISGFGVDILYSNGFIYSSTGSIINPETNTLQGTLAVQGFANGLAGDVRGRRMFFLVGNTLKAFNTSNFQPTGTVTLTNSAHNSARLFRWGRRGFGYRMSDGRLCIFETSLVPAQPNTSDFNGDELADYAVFRPNGALWFASTGMYAVPFGLSTDVPVAADYDGDGKTDVAVYRGGVWYVNRSSDQSFSTYQFGLPTDTPVPADFDGDQKTDYAVYRGGQWHILSSFNSQYSSLQFGLESDLPVPSDFDGDGMTDYAVFRPSNGTWYVLGNSTGRFSAAQFGLSTAQPAPADYDGDGLSDFAVWQNTFGQAVYYVYRSGDQQVAIFALNSANESIPFPVDLDGDGTFDPTVFGPQGTWVSRMSAGGQTLSIHFGTTGDKTITGR